MLGSLLSADEVEDDDLPILFYLLRICRQKAKRGKNKCTFVKAAALPHPTESAVAGSPKGNENDDDASDLHLLVVVLRPLPPSPSSSVGFALSAILRRFRLLPPIMDDEFIIFLLFLQLSQTIL